MTFLAWNLVFAAGISLGAAIRTQESLRVTQTRTALAVSIALILPICVGLIARSSPDVLAWTETRNDLFWTGASKSLQSPLRIINLFAATYLIIALPKAPIIRLIHTVSRNNPFPVLGRKSLEVFVLGAVLALIAERVLWTIAANGIAPLASLPAIAAEFALCSIAIWAMLTIARSDRFTVKRLESLVARSAKQALRQPEVTSTRA